MRPVLLALVGVLAGGGITYGFQAARPVDTAALESCDQLTELQAEMTKLEADLATREAALTELQADAAEVIGRPAPWSEAELANLEATTAATKTSLESTLSPFGGTLLALDCAEDPCIQASIFMGPDADADGFMAKSGPQGHGSLRTLAGRGANQVPHRFLVRTVNGPAEAGGPKASRIDYRMRQVYNQGLARVTFELVDPAKPAMGWQISPEPKPAAEPAPEGGEASED